MITLALSTLLSACPAPAPVSGAAGQAAVARAPAAAVVSLNGEGKALYRQGRWDEARSKYRAALAADPDLQGAALNVACSYARQERFAEAAREASSLVERAFVPWGREVLEATDLAALHVRPEMAGVRAALARGAAAWGASVLPGLLFVARTREPVKLKGQGVLVLGVNQEIFAWLPQTGRYRQVTSDDGRVLAFVRSADGRTVTYLRAGKLVRDGATSLLRGLSLRRLDLPSMTLDASVPLPGDLATVELWPASAGAAELRVRDASGERHVFRFAGQALQPASLSPAAQATTPVTLTGQGLDTHLELTGPADCRYRARDAAGKIDIAPARGKRFTLDTALGAGLFGLPFPRPQ
jgi:hypothetical protein